MSVSQAPRQVSRLFEAARQLQAKERLVLARLLLDSILDAELEAEAD